MVKDNETLSREERAIERDREKARRISMDGPPHASKVLGKVQRAKPVLSQRRSAPRPAKFGGFSRRIPKVLQRIRGAPDKQFSRRAFVRIRYANSKQRGHWRAHAVYLEREGAQREGERGAGFSRDQDELSLSKEAARWQEAGDSRMFKVVLSPEDGDRLDLKEYTRSFMNRLEKVVGQPLEWGAIDHHNTDNPHVHVLIRGANNLQIPREIVQKGAREIAVDEATRQLGYRSQRDIELDRPKDINQRRFTALDREVAKKAREISGGYQVTEPMLRLDAPGYQRRLRKDRIGRLKALEEIGVAEKVGHQTWNLDAGWQKALREMETLQTRSTMLQQHREIMSDNRIQPKVTKIGPGQRLTGRVLGTGIDDSIDAAYLLLEGTDGKAHFIRQTGKIDRLRAENQLQPGRLVSLSGEEFAPGKTALKIEDHGVDVPARGFEKMKLPAKALDADLAAAGGVPPESTGPVGFAGWYQQQMRQRSRERAVEREVAPQPVVQRGQSTEIE